MNARTLKEGAAQAASHWTVRQLIVWLLAETAMLGFLTFIACAFGKGAWRIQREAPLLSIVSAGISVLSAWRIPMGVCILVETVLAMRIAAKRRW